MTNNRHATHVAHLTVDSVQDEVRAWVNQTFGIGSKAGYALDERCLRFFEEATELVQSLGMTKQQALDMVNYTFDRPAGDAFQEFGGTIITYAALANCIDVSIQQAFQRENQRCWDKKDAIKAKQMAKPLRGEGL